MQTPIVMAFLLADKVFREMETGKVHVAGTFNQLSAFSFPMVHGQFFVYLCITECAVGERQLKLGLRYIETGSRILEVFQSITSRGPIDPIEVNLCFNNIRFEQEGNVELVLWLDDAEVMTRTLRIRKVDPKDFVQKAEES